MWLRIFRNYIQVLHLNTLLFYTKVDLEMCPACFVLFCFCESLYVTQAALNTWSSQIIGMNQHTQLLEYFFLKKDIRT